MLGGLEAGAEHGGHHLDALERSVRVSVLRRLVPDEHLEHTKFPYADEKEKFYLVAVSYIQHWT